MPQSRRWLPFGSGAAEAEARMFCLPFAGGGASNFSRWARSMPGAAIVPIQYPGHETRIDEAPFDSIEQMLDGLADTIAPLLDRPYILFGYSMGARLAFALSHRLARRGPPAPLCLMVAANRAPDGVSSAAGAAALPDPQLLELLRSYGGMPDELFDDADFCAMMLPLMRADFSLPKADRRNEFLRVRINADGGLELFPNQGSGVLTSTVWGDGLIDNPPGNPIARGDSVRFIPFSELLH